MKRLFPRRQSTANWLRQASCETLERRSLLSAVYSITDLGELPNSDYNGSAGAIATGVNDQGVVVGYTDRNYGGQTAAFYWTSKNGMQELPTFDPKQPYSTNTDAFAIASDGEVAGDSIGHPVKWQITYVGASVVSVVVDPVKLLLIPAPYTLGSAVAVGEGNFVGYAYNSSSGYYEAAEWFKDGSLVFNPQFTGETAISDSGLITYSSVYVKDPSAYDEAATNDGPLGFLPGDDQSKSTGINSTGNIVGFSSSSSSTSEAVLWPNNDSAAIQGLGFLGHGTYSLAKAINDAGQVVGTSNIVPGGAEDAFVWTAKGGMRDLNTLIPQGTGWKLEEATAISPAGYIVGTGKNPKGQDASFILTPSTLATTSTGNFTVAMTGRLPTTIIAGQAMKIAQNAAVTNSGAATFSGTVSAQLFLSANTTVDSGSISLQSQSRLIKLKPRARTALNFKLSSLSASVPSGTYYLVVQITDPTGNTTDAASAAAVTVVPPEIDFSGSFLKTPKPGKGGKTAVTFNVTNTGNIAAAGSLAFNLESSPDGLPSDATLLTTASRKINIKPGKSTRISDVIVLPAGTYFLVVQLDSKDVFNETDPVTDVFASAVELVVP